MHKARRPVRFRHFEIGLCAMSFHRCCPTKPGPCGRLKPNTGLFLASRLQKPKLIQAQPTSQRPTQCIFIIAPGNSTTTLDSVVIPLALPSDTFPHHRRTRRLPSATSWRPEVNHHPASTTSDPLTMASSQTATKKDDKAAETKPEQQPAADQKPAALEEDDEFEDFPVDDWAQEDTEAASGGGATQHLWEESWDDDDTSDDFSTQLKEELKKVEASKKR
ncbi:hypothetical protein N657DRAFT_642548 [Parathielavia appendiculata]|uniref:26S proteasome complex subunit SEM1 n=1 Tax=Parathielavia appendiculata TaxID=2587402 RepID=A0AAN6Z5X5_9PEZI|nr:hypothetical protein N657DRAFT_642548 [Parathielavia appendiculata]